MTPRWRAVLQVQRLLRVLLANHVPLGVLNVEVDRATHLLDDDLVAAEADISGMGIVYELARGWAQALVGEETFERANKRFSLRTLRSVQARVEQVASDESLVHPFAAEQLAIIGYALGVLSAERLAAGDSWPDDEQGQT